MYTRRCLFLGLIAGGLLRAQDSQPAVQITGAVKQALTLSADDLSKMPRATVKTTSGGMETVYEGVWLHDVLKPLVEHYLDEEYIRKQQIFNIDYIKQLKRSYYVAQKEYDYKIWYLLMFQMWYDRWMNNTANT